MTKIVQVLDTDGNGAYALTHWQAIEGDLKEIIMTDENGDAHTLKVDSIAGLLVDDSAIQDAVFTKLRMQSPNGTPFVISIDDKGGISAIKETT